MRIGVGPPGRLLFLHHKSINSIAKDHWAAGVSRKLDTVAISSGKFFAWMIFPMILSLAFEVIARYGFGKPTMWAYDMTFMLYGTFFMLGASFTLQRQGHIRTDIYYGRWSPRRQAVVDLFGYIVLFYPFILILSFTGFEYFWKAFQTNEKFVSSPWMPVTWPFKLVLPLSGLLLAIQGVSEILKCFVAISTGSWPEKRGDHE